MKHTATFCLAILLHEAGRSAVAAGDTLAHATARSKVRPFVEWPNLPPEVQLGRRLTAGRLLERYIIGEPLPDFGSGTSLDELAEAIHVAEREAIERGLVLVKLGQPWVPFAELPEVAQAGRRRAATYLRERMFIVQKPEVARWTECEVTSLEAWHAAKAVARAKLRDGESLRFVATQADWKEFREMLMRTAVLSRKSHASAREMYCGIELVCDPGAYTSRFEVV